ncbi:MAG: hypothetical protein Q4D23_03335 [Bacteroidales bacterium]|nr:hypothetical protein [Bacteroidales bacterium]
MTISGDSNEETTGRLSLFLFSMQDYERITRIVHVSEELQRFDYANGYSRDVLACYESDSAAIDVRVMLQRKYFRNGERLQLKRLIEIAVRTGVIDGLVAERLLSRMCDIHGKPIEVLLSNGELVSDQFTNAEDEAYGTLLHGDLDKARRLLERPEEMRLLSLAPYILERENLLFEFRDALIAAGVEPLQAESKLRAAVLRGGHGTTANMGITGSPFWSSVIGRDADEADLRSVLAGNSPDDNNVLNIVCQFLDLLQSEPPDKRALRRFVWMRNWPSWGDFTEGSYLIRQIPSFGISTRVMHEGGQNYAQVKVLPHVEAPWLTETPQLLSDTGCLICLTKRGNTWKVNGMRGSGKR